MSDVRTLNYSGIFLSCFAEGGSSHVDMIRNHTLTYVYEGKLEIDTNGQRQIIGKNECVFIRRDHRIKMEKKASGGEQYKGISLTFHRNFLREFYAALPKKEIPKDAEIANISLVKISSRSDIISLFESLTPYFNSDVLPSDEIIALKEKEGVYALLATEKIFYPILFDFTEPWKIDIIEFLNNNYMYELSMEEIASFTGRSLATFKRDFAKLSAMPPQKWLIKRRLEVAYDKLQNEGKKASEVYLEVGFKDISHFYRAFKNQYGYSPRK